MQIIAIDGPAGSGKSSVSKAVAKELGFGYLDTGAAYRALTWAVLNQGLEVAKVSAEEIAKNFDYSISLDPANYWVKVGGLDLTYEIRLASVGEAVSQFAGLPQVRQYMHLMTKALVHDSGLAGVVVEGRDITTAVFPEAQKRILLTASEEVRLVRRSAELPEGTSIADQVTKRDQNDSKVVDFLVPAAGVHLVDSTELDFDSTVKAIIALIAKD
ncbi:MAG: (d)CMP kinase [Actinobacteria bacterium]|uniref:(d)CMP kinase n=1 Tax=freshwater metagenome TaxID=449393 RepID=A0A6J6NT65_9ZZZZ|nr:(d)CMP kinase [Actinomycetota bacterium]